MLDTRRLQMLRAVATTGSVSAAAANLGYTPSAVSQQMTVLEREAGLPLLERIGRGVRLTSAGRLLTEHAGRIGDELAAAETALAALREGRTGRIAVRYFASAGGGLLPVALARFREEHPGVEVELKLIDPADPLPEVKEGRADLALVVRPPGRGGPGVRLLHLLDDPYLAVLPQGHPLAEREEIALTELAGEPWVDSEVGGPCREPLQEACAAAGFSPSYGVQSGDYGSAQGFVAAGLGVALVPRLGLAQRHPGVVVRPVRGPEPVRVIQAAVREAALGLPAVRGLLDTLRNAAGPPPA
ncbi:LysR family transcriptional regulator [Streptomyces sp. NPDC051940]|uniref:LysR family transcriptional regulator n=1 Tax=Streptomyces sp. NPDC051940 TaxID=3155675 RepID=UPI00341DEB76